MFSPDELYWEYDYTLDKDRENTAFTYVPSPSPSTRSNGVDPFGSSAAGGSGASTPQYGNTGGSGSAGPSGSHPSSPGRERSSRRQRREERERRRQARDERRAAEGTSETRDRGSGREGGREPRREGHRERSHTRERARTREQDAPPSRDETGPAVVNVPRPRTKSNPNRPPPLNFGSSSNLRSFTVPDPQRTVPQNQLEQSHYRAVLQRAQDDGQELPMPPRLGRDGDPDTGSLRSFRSFRSLIGAATGAANATKDRGKAREQPSPFGTPVAVRLPSSGEPPETEQQRRKMEKEQEKARKKLEKEQKKEAEARRKAEEKERERAAKLERDGMKAPGLADKLKTIARGPSRSGSNASSLSGHAPGEPASAVNLYPQSHYSGAAGRGTPQPGAPHSNAPFVLDLLESAVCESPRHALPLPPKNVQEGTLKKAKSFLLFWKG